MSLAEDVEKISNKMLQEEKYRGEIIRWEDMKKA